MNKTVTINLAGLVFYIEENAYQILKDYLSAIKNHFRNEEGCEEIVADIESRLAELLKAVTHVGKQVLTDADINQAINTMGKPEDFSDGTAEETQQQSDNRDQKNRAYKTQTRRVFRDGDNKILGGVCSGLASYFDTDPLWIRLALVVLFFGFGSGLLLYIILWIIIPEAKTTAEKLEMRGDPIDINTISQTIKEEAEQFKNRVQDFGKDVKNEYHNQKKSGVGNKMGHLLHTIFYSIFTIISKVFGGVFVLFGILFLVVLLLVLFNIGTIDHLSTANFFNTVVGENFPLVFTKFGLVLFAGIPLCMLVYKGMKLILGIKVRYRWLNLSAGILWFAGLMICFFQAMSIVSYFSTETQLKEQVAVVSKPADILYLKAHINYVNSGIDIDFPILGTGYLINTELTPNVWRAKPRIKIITSENDSMYVFILRSSLGADKPEAAQRAKKISYSISQHDSTLLIDKYFAFASSDKLRGQEVEILIKLPKNKVVYLDENLKRLLYDVENTNNILDDEMVGKYWKMTSNGLNCLSCTPEDLEHTVNEINQNDEDAHVHIDKDGIEVNSKDGHVKISSEDGIHIEEKKNNK